MEISPRFIRLTDAQHASGAGMPAAIVRSGDVSLSKWVNEKFPSLNEILSAHEVARLTRRHRWVLAALTLLGRFPKQQRFRGRAIGWRRGDLDLWLREKRRRARRAGELISSSHSSARSLPVQVRHGARRCHKRRAHCAAACRRDRSQPWPRRTYHDVLSARKISGDPDRPEKATMDLFVAPDERFEP